MGIRIAPKQRRGALRPHLHRQAGPPELDLVGTHQHVADLVYRDAVPGLPGLRCCANQFVLHRQRPGGGDEGIHASGIGIKHTLCGRA